MTLETLAQYAGGALAVVACFGFIIFIHELGHFVVARWAGIRCPEFAIGFGAKLFKFRWRATEFSLRVFPFGGFVMMTGEEPETEDSWHNHIAYFLGEAPFPARPAQLLAYLEDFKAIQGDLVDSPATQARYNEVKEHLEFSKDREYRDLADVEGNFNNKSIPARIAVVVGGVVMNFIAALFLFCFVGMAWGMAEVAQVYEPIVASVSPNGPAEAAGIKAQDVIVEVEGQPIATGSDMVKEIGKFPGKKMHLKVQRKKELLELEVTPNTNVGGVFFEPAGDKVRVWTVVARQSPFKLGEVIKSVDGQSYTGMDGFVELMQARADAKKVTLEVEGRGPVELTGKLAPEGKIGVAPGAVIRLVIVPDAVGLVTAVQPGSPAEKAGLKPGDGLMELNGRHVFGQTDLTEMLAALENKEIVLDVARDGEPVELKFNGPVGGFGALGVTLQPVTPGMAVQYAFLRVGRLIVQPYELIADILTKKREAKEVGKEMGGPIMIMNMIYDISSKGLPSLLFFLALLNAAVGAFNLLPVPALDGSRLFFLVLAGIRGKEMDPDKEARIHYYGLLVLLALVALISIQDVGRIFSGQKFFK